MIIVDISRNGNAVYSEAMSAIKHLIIRAKKAKDHISAWPKQRQFLIKDMPYFCQWESADLAADILSHTIEAKVDPRWQQSGAASPEEYQTWSWAACGMACLKMILAHHTGNIIPVVTLGKKCLDYGGYTLPLESSPGLYYRPFLRFIEKEFTLRGKVSSAFTIREITHALANGSYVIASVNPAIRNPNSITKTKGGHLVLATGYDLDRQEIIIHNPSGNTPESQDFAKISFKDFDKFYSHRAIVIG